jgi:23S rRNA (guanosine2251-2'-O)-methyltransferase
VREIPSPIHPISIVCDNIRSLANVGAIFRLADAIRAERLYLCGISGYPPIANDSRPPWVAERAERHIARTAIHTTESVAWEHRSSAIEVIRELKSNGAQIVALERTASSVDYARAAYQLPVCLVVGHERSGVADPILELADLTVAIPMFGTGRSLNVAMALGICAYELVRRCPDQRDTLPS